MSLINQASWIWSVPSEQGKDLYRIFRGTFQWEAEGSLPVILEIAADSTFALFLNGRRCPIAQLADLPKDRTYSTLDITNDLNPGKNVIAVEVHYIGESFLTYRPGTPFLKAAVSAGGQILAKTDSTWKSADSTAYVSGLACKVTSQLGYVFSYDARKELPWKELDYDDSAWSAASVCEDSAEWEGVSARTVPQLKELPVPETALVQQGYLKRESEEATFALSVMRDFLVPRIYHDIYKECDPQQMLDGGVRRKLYLKPENNPAFTYQKLSSFPAANGYYVIVDLERESVGYLFFRIHAPEGTVIDIAHGEHLNDGRVRAYCGGRNFTDRFICREGENEFLYSHRRIGARYLELHFTHCDSGEVTLYYAGILPLELPLPEQASFSSEDRILMKLNEISIDTLKLCMHEHYEDCPWREQGLYAYDSRNQILYGYYVWGNYDFAASSLNLLGKSYDGDRYLALTSPGNASITIPVFTMVWITELYEYQLFSGSSALFERWSSQVDRILDRALSEREPEAEGLYHPGAEKYVWNFCEWNGALSSLKEYPQAPYNIYLYEALISAAKLHEYAGNQKRADFLRQTAKQLGLAIERTFWNPERSIYGALSADRDELGYEHIQAIMLSNHLVPDEKRNDVMNSFLEKKLRGIDLSALYYLVNGLMNGGAEARSYLAAYLHEIFEPIVFSGATSLWETRGAGDDFYGAGSLCHAWSSVMPYVCGNRILGVSPLEPGFRRFAVRPCCFGLTHAEGEIPTPSGKIYVSWKRAGDSLDVQVKHPIGTTAVLESWEEDPIGKFEAVVYTP